MRGYRHFLRTAPDVQNTTTTANLPVCDEEEALLCAVCNEQLRGRRPQIPKFSVRNGIDSSNAHLYLPKLSTIENLLLSKYQVYGHVLTLGAGGQHGMKGHMVAMVTTSCVTTVEAMRAHDEERQRGGQILVLPHSNLEISVQYCGPMDRWQRIMANETSLTTLRSLFGVTLSVCSRKLMMWIDFLSCRLPHLQTEQGNNPRLNPAFTTAENRNQLDQRLLDQYMNEFLRHSSVHAETSIANQILERSTLNVPGAGESENTAEEIGAVEHVFLDMNEEG
jgi:hypothetical protein